QRAAVERKNRAHAGFLDAARRCARVGDFRGEPMPLIRDREHAPPIRREDEAGEATEAFVWRRQDETTTEFEAAEPLRARQTALVAFEAATRNLDGRDFFVCRRGLLLSSDWRRKGDRH